MALTFLNARIEVSRQLGLDYTKSTQTSVINTWLNLTMQEIVGYHEWTWLQEREIVTLKTDYTTGTVSATSGSATITFSDVIATSQAGRRIQFSSSDAWYDITAHTLGTATATISPSYAPTSNLVAGTYKIRTFEYSLSSSAEKVFNCTQAYSNRLVPIIPVYRADSNIPFTDETGETKGIYLWGQDTSGNWTFTPYPFPDDVYLLDFRIFKKITDLTTDGSSPGWPNRFDSAWIMGACRQGYRFLDDAREGTTKAEYFGMLDNLVKKDEVGTTEHYILQAVDGGSNNRTIIEFPAEFGRVR